MPEFAQPAWLGLIALALAVLALSLRRGRRGELRLAAAGALRAAALACLAVALAGPLARTETRHTDVVFALDVSSSIERESIAQALALVNQARESPARVGLVVFGADAAVESLVRPAGEPIHELSALVERSGTDIGRAIEVAVGAFQEGSQRRIVLMSDGRENQGDARAAAAVARSLGVQIHSVTLEQPASRNEIRVQAVTAPAQVRMHEPFKVQATVHSRQAARAHLVLMRNGVLLHELDVALEPGENVYAFVEQADKAGLQEYEAIVNSDADSEPENNRYQAFVQVSGRPRVLHAMGDPQAGRYVTAALEAQGLAVDEVSASGVPANLHELLDYELVILNNVSGFDLSLGKMELLEHYVRDAGGGVIKLGGDRSYAAGGYYGTPVERLLPVTMNVKTEVKIPSLSVVFVLDRSGSMGTKVQGEEKLAIAKRAALLSIDLLNRLDRVGVLAFDSGQEWIVSPTEAAMRKPIIEKLHNLQVGGGTDLYRALEEAYRVMRNEQAKVKHLIVLSDGITEGEKNFEDLGARIAADGITISTVAMGSDADRALMARLSELGKGRFYHTEDPANVPRIFTSEALTITRDLVVEGDFRPRPAAAGEPTKGFAADAFPPLGGYQRAYAKPAAQVLLAAPEDDPLLVAWRYGLGRAVAFTSDLTGRWGRRWIAWPEFGRFVAQTARWTMRRHAATAFVPQFSWHGGRGEMTLDALDRDERFVNGLALEATIVDPAQSTQRVRLEQIAPGRYHASFRVSRAGRYYITVDGRDGPTEIGASSFGLAVPYSSEYLDQGVDRSLLRDVAAATEGELLPFSSASVAAMTAPSPARAGPRAGLWRPLVLAALLLLVIEVAVRKVQLPETWLARWARWRAARKPSAGPEPDYEALRAALAAERTRHLAELGAGEAPDADDAAARARLHVASGRRR